MTRKLLVTGALGHIGSRLIRTLPKAFPGVELVLVDDLSCQRYPSLFDLPETATYRFVEADVRDADWDELLPGADGVVHLAALTDAANSLDKRDAVLAINATATERLARACMAQDVPLIFPSTTSVYGSQASVVDEDTPEEELRPQSPYAESKLVAERTLQTLAKEGLRVTILRLGTIVGVSPGMRFHTAVNKFCWQACNGVPISVWRTALHQKRPYLDLEDAVGAVAHVLADPPAPGTLFTVVTENRTVHDVVTAIQARLPETRTTLVDSRIMNQLSYEVRCERLLAHGFEPTGSIRASIDATLSLLAGLHRDAARVPDAAAP